MIHDCVGPILLVGGGRMGCALLRGCLSGGINPGDIFIQDPELSTECRELVYLHGLSVNLVPTDIPAPAVVLLAVKPQVMDHVLLELNYGFCPETVYVSIAAGYTLSRLSAHFGEASSIVRAMPNIAAAVGRSMTVVCANTNVTGIQRDLIDTLLRMVGSVSWVETERYLDVATAVSGSGPAYIFYLTECLAAAGEASGLSTELALFLARETVQGAGEMMRCCDNQSPADLRRLVTSPNGTTAEALSILGADGGLHQLMDRAVNAAVKKAMDLSRI